MVYQGLFSRIFVRSFIKSPLGIISPLSLCVGLLGSAHGSAPGPGHNRTQYLGISKFQGGDQDSFDAKDQDYPDPTGRVDHAWSQGRCREM